MESIEKFKQHFTVLYGEDAVEECLERLQQLTEAYESDIRARDGSWGEWSEEDSILITYGDVLQDINRPKMCRLALLEEFLEQHVGRSITSLHLLPFFPSSSDGGFAVIDYKKVREDLGDWSHIQSLAEQYRLMADLVINHTSWYNEWFQNFKEGKEPGKDYFIEVDPTLDLSEVVRPRSSALLTPVQTSTGNTCVWTTFSEDQVDMDFSNPEVLFEFIDIFLFYLSKGIQVVRLDAIAYLWKELGTNCIHLPETHEVVKLFRTLVEEIAPHVTLVTETNVPHKENISYFGEGDEAHMVYQFSLPPLLLHAILTGNSEYLTEWADGLKEMRKGCYYLNFTASHDGIGVRPLEGLVPEDEFNYMLEAVHKREGFVSYKTNRDGSKSPYELNITYFDAFSDLDSENDDIQVARYLCSQAIMLAFKGIPGIYFHNLTATRNNVSEAISTGHKRAINRKQWDYDDLIESLQDETTNTHRVMKRYKEMLRIRGDHPAFHPDAPQQIFDCGNDLFVLKRTSLDGNDAILSVSNITGNRLELNCRDLPLPDRGNTCTDLLSDRHRCDNGTLVLEPYEPLWLEI
ncbi:MAG: sugar phosphorylase [Balneolaceae bacterium]|nr:sugar phosphorylase [Balneolaceae bacterium]